MQILPKDHDFTDVAFTSSPSSLAMYYHLIPAAGTAENQYTYAQLHDGYYKVFGFPGGAAATREANLPTDASATVSACAWTHRDIFPEDQVVSARFGLSLAAGSTFLATEVEQLLENSVFARLQGGTLVNDGLSGVGFEDISGYQLQVRGTGGPPFTAMEWRLVRWNSGVRTLIAKEEFGFPFSVIRPKPIFQMAIELSCVDNGGDVDISCKFGSLTFESSTGIGPAGIPPGGQKTITNFPMFSSLTYTLTLPTGVTHVPSTGVFTDASAGKLTGASHCGFGMGRDRDYGSGVQAVDYCSRFTVKNPAGVSLHNDTFVIGGTGVAQSNVSRTVQPQHNPGAGISQLTFTDGLGVVGYSLQSEFMGDEFSASSIQRDFKIETPNEQAVVLPKGATSENYNSIYSMRPPTDLYLQRRSVDITFNTGTGIANLFAGIQLFGNGLAMLGTLADLNAQRGYVAYFYRTETGGTQLLRIGRLRGAGITTLAEVDAASLFTVGTAKNLDFQVWHEDLAPQSTGPVIMQVKVGGVAIAAWDTLLAGATDAGSGIIRDATVNRINSGFEAMFTGSSEITSTGYQFNFDNWTEQAFTDPNAPPPPDQDGIVITGEAAPVGTFTAPVDLRFSQVSKSYKHRTDFDSGHALMVKVLPDVKRWKATQSGASQAELDYVLQFWRDHRAGEIPFTFTPSGYSTAYTAYLIGDRVEWSRIGVDVYDLSFELEESP